MESGAYGVTGATAAPLVVRGSKDEPDYVTIHLQVGVHADAL
jgi:hypothetical protein